MFIYTAKLNRKKLIAIILAVAILVCLIVVLVSAVKGSNDAPVSAGNLKTNADRIEYLKSLGWEVEEAPLEVQNVVIPREFTGVYASYVALQREQGYTLEKYGGMNAVRYTYRVTNYPTGEKNIVADMIIYSTSIIAGDIQCTALDGFMEALKKSE